MTHDAAHRSGGTGTLDARFSVAALVDVDDFVALTCSHGNRWGEQAIAWTDALIHRSVQGHPVYGVRHTPPDEWLLNIVGSAQDEVTKEAVVLAESIHRSARRAAPVPVTVTVTLSDVHDGTNSEALAEADARRRAGQKLLTGGDRVIHGSDRPVHTHRHVPSSRVSSELARLTDLNDPDGVHRLLVDWIERCASDEATTPQALREWIVGELLFVFGKLARARMRDGSIDWLAGSSSFALSRILEVADIHERSYLNIWLGETLAEAFGERAGRPPVNPLLAAAERYIAQHLGDPGVGLESVARAVSMSPFYLAHLFRDELDTTFRRYLAARRLERAQQLLRDPDLAIEEIARRTGHRSARQFRLVFRRERGCTPTDYRRDYCVDGRYARSGGPRCA